MDVDTRVSKFIAKTSIILGRRDQREIRKYEQVVLTYLHTAHIQRASFRLTGYIGSIQEATAIALDQWSAHDEADGMWR